MVNNILVIGHERSGSTYVIQLLRKISNLKTYLEIFHFFEDEIISHLYGDWPKVAEKLRIDPDNRTFKPILTTNCYAYINALSEINMGVNFVYKVFPFHLPDQELRTIISMASAVLLIRRNLLHAYISNVIANQIQEWGGIDTSQKVISFNLIDFCQFVKGIILCYDYAMSAASHCEKKICFIDYEILYRNINPLSVIEKLVRDCLGEAVIHDHGPVEFIKQDRRSSALDKVTNADEMRQFLHEIHLTSLIDGNTNCSHDKYKESMNTPAFIKALDQFYIRQSNLC